MAKSVSLFLLFLHLLSSLAVSRAQASDPVPPLQWINLTGLLSGSAPPPLKDAAVGYDETSRSMIIFGGESADGFPQSQTYLLNLNDLTWSTPSPPTNLQTTPSARSAAIYGCDFAASNRHGFVVIGGKGSNGQALSDVWEYDFTNQFWSQVSTTAGGPSARWGASGGIDTRSTSIQDPVLPGPNNTFYLAGGFDGTNVSPLSEVWRFNISGTLSSNLPNSMTGSWDSLKISGSLPSVVDQGGTVVLQQVIAAGGCNDTSATDDSCAEQSSFVLNTATRGEISPNACPAPRFSPVLIPNLNTFSTSFSSQVFQLLGTFNSSLWQDSGGLNDGEVSVLNINTGSWSRVLPAGDPGSSSQNPIVPTPREGAAAVVYSQALVGSSRSSSSDIIVFGGRDESGKYLSELWLLRAYDGSVTPSSSSFKSGNLESGINADGSGVTVKYLTACATAISTPTSTSSGSHSTSSSRHSTSTSAVPSSTQSSGSSDSLTIHPFDTAVVHKVLAPVSIALLLPAVLLFRLSSPSFHQGHSTEPHVAGIYLSGLLAVAAYGLGVGGLATAFTTITSTATTLTKRSSSSSSMLLKTGHGRAGLAFFLGLYGVIPLLMLLSAYLRRNSHSREEGTSDKAQEARELTDLHPTHEEKLRRGNSNHSAPLTRSPTSPAPSLSPRRRTHSWAPSSFWPPLGRSQEGRLSSDSSSVNSSAGPHRGFEVTNRPSRNRQAQKSWQNVLQSDGSNSHTPTSLGDVDWMQRRRSLNAVGELDYAITHSSRLQTSTPGTTEPLLATPLEVKPRHIEIPSPLDIVIHVLFHAFLLGLCVVSLVALWSRAPRASFAVFLAWIVVFYALLLMFAWNGRPEQSVLTVLFTRLRAEPLPIHDPSVFADPLPPPTATDEQFPFPSTPRSPYVHHQPQFSVAHTGTGVDEMSVLQPRSVETDEEDDDVDDETRQRQIEEEMERRDVHIVTVPKRKLRITNPS